NVPAMPLSGLSGRSMGLGTRLGVGFQAIGALGAEGAGAGGSGSISWRALSTASVPTCRGRLRRRSATALRMLLAMSALGLQFGSRAMVRLLFGRVYHAPASPIS